MIVFYLNYAKIYSHPRCGVTANIPVLGTGDSGFESRHLDKEKSSSGRFFEVNEQIYLLVTGFERVFFILRFAEDRKPPATVVENPGTSTKF